MTKAYNLERVRERERKKRERKRERERERERETVQIRAYPFQIWAQAKALHGLCNFCFHLIPTELAWGLDFVKLTPLFILVPMKPTNDLSSPSVLYAFYNLIVPSTFNYLTIVSSYPSTIRFTL